MNRADWQRIEDRAFNPGRVALYAGALALCYAIFLATGHFDKVWLFDVGVGDTIEIPLIRETKQE